MGHQFGADVFPMVHHSVGVILDYNEYQLSEQRFVNRFLDLKYRFNWVSKRMDFGLQWNNILNTKTHEQVFVQEALTSVTTFALRPSQVLASVRFTFGN
ncbi:hypothetical protein [Flavobacterium sp. JP2137]|uniref:hypothetical protein n=1 Tax=Flavobacterium sp. JP2137 TaxID=3414510 RepID=UPI003D2F9CEF